MVSRKHCRDAGRSINKALRWCNALLFLLDIADIQAMLQDAWLKIATICQPVILLPSLASRAVIPALWTEECDSPIAHFSV